MAHPAVGRCRYWARVLGLASSIAFLIATADAIQAHSVVQPPPRLGEAAVTALPAPVLCPPRSLPLELSSVQIVAAAGRALDPPPSVRVVCRTFPFADESLGDKFAAAWRGFDLLATVQVVVPAAANLLTGALAVQVNTTGTGSSTFSALHGASVTSTTNGSMLLPYPAPGTSLGDPLHATLVRGVAPGGADGRALIGLFVSFESGDHGTWGGGRPGAADGHYVALTTEADLPGAAQAGWSCMSASTSGGAGGATVAVPWVLGQPVVALRFSAALATDAAARALADGQPLTLHLADDADIGAPVSNTYADHAVADSAACRALCGRIAEVGPKVDLFSTNQNDPAHSCALAGPPAFRSRSGYGPISVLGYGMINGQTVMRRFLFHNQSVWDNPGNGVLNGYGSVVGSFQTIGDAEAHTRWRVMSGLLELSSSSPAAPGRPFAIDVQGLSVAWGLKRGDGSLRLQFPRVPLDGPHTASDSNRPVRLYDVKTPGTWVGASDGPRVTADGSRVEFAYLHHADDNLKVDSTRGVYRHITLLQGNIGSAIELGTYGIGIRDNAVSGARVDGVAIHRVTQDPGGQDDHLGSVLGSRTCPWGITLRNISLQNVHVHQLGVGGANDSGNRFASLWAIGTLGEPYGPAYERSLRKLSTLDRWFFCSNEWWRGCTHGGTSPSCNQVRQTGPAAVFTNLTIGNWSGLGAAAGSTPSFLYNFHPNASTSFSDVKFDGTAPLTLMDAPLGERPIAPGLQRNDRRTGAGDERVAAPARN